jgi:hypothetical protein
VAAIALLVALAAAEAALRLAEPRSARLARLLYLPQVRTHFEAVSTTPELLRQSALGFHPHGRTPGFILNSRGFRTHEYRDEKAAGSIRVVVLGDSFAFDSHGVPIAWMWHQVFGRALEERVGRDVEVISLSAPGVGPRFALRLWELEGERLAPDLVVLAFFVGNDFTDESGFDLEVGIEGRAAQHSLLVRLLRNATRLRRAGAPAAAAAPARGEAASQPTPGEAAPRGGYELADYAATYDPSAPTFDRAAYLDLEQARVAHFAGPPEERFDRLFADTALVVARMARQVELGGARFLVMIIPDEAQVDDRLWRQVSRRFPPRIRLERDRPQERLRSFLVEHGIAHLDLLPAIRRHDERLYKPRDSHWNARGNAAAGAALAEAVVELELLPRDP